MLLLQQTNLWWQIGFIVLSAIITFTLNHYLQRKLHQNAQAISGLRRMAVRGSQRMLWPFTLAILLAISNAILKHQGLPHSVINFLMPIVLALGVIRILLYILRKAFIASALAKTSETAIAIIIWLIVILHLTDFLTPLLTAMDSLAFTLGESKVSLLAVLKLILVIIFAFTFAIWLAELLNQRLKRSKHISPSMQVGFSKFSKVFLITLAFLIALNAVGINLSSLAIFGGALGVGLGFGLQRIASNFISGFILVLDRSIKPGDVISVGDNFGWVHELKARYVVVRNREGVDTLIPNENLITSEVINWSYDDRNVRLKIVVRVSYNDDPEQAMAIMLRCANKSIRVLASPEPTVMLKSFAENGIEIELRVWIGDPEYGEDTVKSDIHVAIWRAFKEAKITIPYPQRELHIRSDNVFLPKE
ncbi:mechanosensitive ion channel protein MscS [Rheinheimera salexigens]|uniref:Mechanosensitive ion channel protein MscS n=2 Tax=Rheinheimera salexigens TaxID=1628148 RepID=A0A1E7QAQ2_9GAMM|nr:mechanosensitive ion channel protein MscS [Rheinheimera salexigens]